MKKIYISPILQTVHVQPQQMMALSLQTNKADSSDALVKGNDWDIWGEGEEAASSSPFED